MMQNNNDYDGEIDDLASGYEDRIMLVSNKNGGVAIETPVTDCYADGLSVSEYFSWMSLTVSG